jgi:hypothetical protein
MTIFGSISLSEQTYLNIDESELERDLAKPFIKYGFQ